VIAGTGVVSSAIGFQLLQKRSNLKVIIAEKENNLAMYAIGH